MKTNDNELQMIMDYFYFYKNILEELNEFCDKYNLNYEHQEQFFSQHYESFLENVDDEDLIPIAFKEVFGEDLSERVINDKITIDDQVIPLDKNVLPLYKKITDADTLYTIWSKTAGEPNTMPWELVVALFGTDGIECSAVGDELYFKSNKVKEE